VPAYAARGLGGGARILQNHGAGPESEGGVVRIFHLNCISGCPLGGLLMDGVAAARVRGRLTSHCLLVQTDTTLVLVDTGYGLRDVASPRTRLSPVFLALLKPELRQEMTAVRQVERLGFQARDIRHILLSHLDFDHAGGLDDFPEAEVHLLADEVDSATAQRTSLDRMRYRPEQWDSRARWHTYRASEGERWFGFARVRDLPGIGPDLLLVPLPGHTLGHAGVAVRRKGGWLFYAADAYFYQAEMDPVRPHCTPGLRMYQTLMEKDRVQRLANQQRLRELRAAGRADVELFCAHDVSEFERLSGRSPDDPARVLKAPATMTPVEGPTRPARA
jgi:glyoxylase-like metal-dependent hydrolase (beta-lactamase superfamily II)